MGINSRISYQWVTLASSAFKDLVCAATSDIKEADLVTLYCESCLVLQCRLGPMLISRSAFELCIRLETAEHCQHW